MSSHEKNSFLILRLSSFGDVLLTTCVARELKNKYPTCSITFIVKKTFVPMIESNPNIDTILIYQSDSNFIEELRLLTFDYLIDLQNNQRSWKLGKKLNIPIYKYQKGRFKRFLYMNFGYKKFNSSKKSVSQKYLDVLAPLQIYSTNTAPEFFLSGTNTNKISKPYICFAPGAAHFTKQWPKESYIQLIHLLKESWEIVLLGGPDETETAKLIQLECDISYNFVGKTNFNETAHLISSSELLICNDSSVMHLATSLKKKVLVFFGSTVEQFGFFPYDTKHTVLQNTSLPCRPCTHIGRASCPKKHLNCLTSISAEKAFEEAKKLLEC